MKRILAILLIFLLVFACSACDSTEDSGNSMADAYKNAAQAKIDEGDYAGAIQILEDGYGVTQDPVLQEMITEVKALEQQAQETTAPTAETTEAPTEETTEATEPETTTAPVVQQSNYPIQIDMDDMLSANLLGKTFYSACKDGSLEYWMFLYVHDSSDPEVIYESVWFDTQLNQITYYGILKQQAEEAGWGDVWVALINGDDYTSCEISLPEIYTIVPEPTETPVVTEPVQAPSYNAEYWNDIVPTYTLNEIAISPRHVYWSGDKLVAECYIINGRNSTCFNFELKKLGFENNGGIIADGYFGVLQDLTINPYAYVIWTFTFSADAVYQQGADLNDLNCYFEISYSY